MSQRRSYGGGPPHRAVQNQAFCRTGRPRRTVRYRKRPCGVREVHLSAGAARGGGSSAGATESWAIGGWWLRDWAAGGREVSNNEQNNDLSCWVLLTGKVLFCLIVSVLSATAERSQKAARERAGQDQATSGQAGQPAGQTSNSVWPVMSQDNRAGRPKSSYTRQVQARMSQSSSQSEPGKTKPQAVKRAQQVPPGWSATIKAGRRYFFRWPLWSLQRP